MQPALMLVAAATLGCGTAEFRLAEPNDLLAAAFVARLNFDAHRSIDSVSPEAVALEVWYPPVPAINVLDVAGPSDIDARRDVTYDLSLPFFRSKP
jgi:hypothetical protein